MGNSPLRCFRGGGKVKVVLLNGNIVEFGEPVRASTVMRKYPRHIVLHCCMPRDGGSGQRRKISVLGPDQVLRRNERYVLTPIQSTKDATTILDSWAFFTINAAFNKKLNAKAKSRSSSTRRWWFQTVLDKICRTMHSPDEEETRPFLHFEPPKIEPQKVEPRKIEPRKIEPREIESRKIKSRKIESRKSADGFQDWRPSLERIPESPTHGCSNVPQHRRNSSFGSYPRLHFH